MILNSTKKFISHKIKCYSKSLKQFIFLEKDELHLIDNIDIFKSQNYQVNVKDSSNNILFKELGFKPKRIPILDYQWSNNYHKFHKNNFTKSKLVKDSYDKLNSENEIMRKRKFHKIWNSGILKYEWKKGLNLST